MPYEYNSYLKRINEWLRDDPLYRDFHTGFEKGTSDFRIIQKVNKKLFDLEWVDVIEECLVPLDEIVRNPRKFIVIEEDIIDISLARSISVESVRHLAQHTNLIAMVDEKKGTVTPSKILNTAKEESYEVYENRFIYTLISHTTDFVKKKKENLKKNPRLKDNKKIEYNSSTLVGEEKINVSIQLNTDLDTNLNLDKKIYERIYRRKRVKK